jgi:hypothetical protein
MLLCMRTTVRLDPHLLKDAKKLAADTHRTLTKVIEDALREAIAKRGPAKRKRVELPISKHSGGLAPGLDLDNNATFTDLMDDELYGHFRR